MTNNLTAQQSEAVRHLQEWKVGALFMEPGTGKTRASMTLVNSSPCTGVVWIGPLRTLEAVQSEVEKWGGFKAPVTYWGVESLSSSDRIFTELINTLGDCSEPFVVVDESLKIKNADELLRYKQLSGIAELFKDREFTQTNNIF